VAALIWGKHRAVMQGRTGRRRNPRGDEKKAEPFAFTTQNDLFFASGLQIIMMRKRSQFSQEVRHGLHD
jgi:hypothetical protein